ncbi:MAG: hypothetical protein AAF384_13925 [Pseudomonadota bacterium]
MQLIPHRGIDGILLGAERDTVVRELGKPEKSGREEWEDGVISETWVYRLMRLELSFDSDNDFLLSRITASHPHLAIQSFNPIGLEEGYLLQKYPHLDLEANLGANGKQYIDRLLDLSYWLSKGKVESVTVFPQYDQASDQIAWPAI